MATTVEDLVLRFSAETEKLSRDLKKVERDTDRSGKKAAKSTDKISKSLKGVSAAAKKAGAAMVAAFAGGAALRGLRQTFSAMNDLQTAADGLGVSVELIQELRFAFVAAGADAGKVESILRDFTKRVGEARSGLGTLLPFLKDFNISLNNVDGTVKTSEQLFDELTDTIAGLEDNTQRGALANAAFGRTWVDVVAVLGDGSKALATVRREARETGAVISADLVEAAAAADVEFNKLILTLNTILKGGLLTGLQEFGVIDRTALQETLILLDKQKKTLDDLLAKRDMFREGSRLDRENTEAINEANDALLITQQNLEGLLPSVEAVDDGVKNITNDLKVMRERMKEIRVLTKDLIINPQEMAEGLEAMDKAIAGLTKRTIKLGPAAEDSLSIFANTFEDIILDIGSADDAVRNLIASFGQLILRQAALKAASAVVSVLPFADGGVMTGQGSMPLQKYAGGGIATTPQLALFGEGSKPEAFVPLPDGRSIPVTVKGEGGGMNGGGGVVVNQENHFTVDVRREVQAQLLGFAPALIQASAEAVDTRNRGITI